MKRQRTIGRLSLVVITMGMVVGLMTAAPAQATTPGRNGRITFASDLGLGAEIYSIRHHGTGFRQLTELDGNATHPDVSPDGSRIVFWLEDQAIYVMNSDGSDLHVITTPGGTPSFTPDGQSIVYECASQECGGVSGIFLMKADGSDAPGVRLTTNPFPDEGDSDPQVSPDGETVTFVRHKVDGELQALFAVDVDGSNERQLTSYRLEVGIKHDWAPDGEHIVVTAHADFPRGQSANVATIEADGSDLTYLTKFQGGEWSGFAGSYSPDGNWIVFRIQNPSLGIFRLMKMRPDGRDKTLIESLPFGPRFIDWGSR